MKIKEVRNSGFVFEDDDPQDFILGASPLNPPPVVFPTGHGWAKYRSKWEMQFNKKFDSYSCVIFSEAKALVAFLKKVYDIDITISEMFNAYYAGVVPNRGTSVRKGMESFRKKGWVSDEEYPFKPDMTANEYFKKPPLEIEIKAKGKLTKWKVRWEAINRSGNVSHSKIREALKRTPVICSGFAWASKNGIYKSYGNPNHLFLVDDYSNNPKYDLIVYDSYPQDNKFDTDSTQQEFVKKLSKDYRISSAHRIWLEPIGDSLIKKVMDYFIRLKNGAIYWGKGGTQKIQKITPQNAGLAAITHIMRKEEVLNIDSEADLEDYEITEEFFGSEELGIAKELMK